MLQLLLSNPLLQVHNMAAAEARMMRECAGLRKAFSEAEARKEALQEGIACLEGRLAARMVDKMTMVRISNPYPTIQAGAAIYLLRERCKSCSDAASR